MRLKGLLLVVFVWAGLGLFYPPAFGQEKENAPVPTDSEVLKLYEAVMCEDIYANAPRNPTVVFSATQEKAVCFTAFDPVPQPTFIYHNWFYRDIPSAKIRLGVQPPRWSTYSSIQIRKTDIGPWRVEITDEKGTVLRTLRFSITE
jgi:hypothetical protein